MTPSAPPRDERPRLTVLDLFSAAAGGWSLGMHRAGFSTVAACEAVEWRRILYAENNPGVPIYDDVRTLTAERLRCDLGTLPVFVVGSPPCQDISSANTKGRGVEGERSGLFFEGVRIIGEVRPRWFALENSANLRTRGADRVLGALEALGYTCWTFVVGGDDIGANHERKRSWIIGCDLAQLADAHEAGRQVGGVVSSLGRPQEPANGAIDGRGGEEPTADADGLGRDEGRRRRSGFDLPFSKDPRHSAQDGRRPGIPGRRAGATDEPEQPPRWDDVHAPGERHEGRRAWRYGAHGDGAPPTSAGHDADAPQERPEGFAGGAWGWRESEVAERSDLSPRHEVGLRTPDRGLALQHRADWSLDDLARHIRLDDGLPAWLAEQRIAVGGPRGTSAASLIVEAFGDAVLPQIPEAIGRAILRVESAYVALVAPTASPDNQEERTR